LTSSLSNGTPRGLRTKSFREEKSDLLEKEQISMKPNFFCRQSDPYLDPETVVAPCRIVYDACTAELVQACISENVVSRAFSKAALASRSAAAHASHVSEAVRIHFRPHHQPASPPFTPSRFEPPTVTSAGAVTLATRAIIAINTLPSHDAEAKTMVDDDLGHDYFREKVSWPPDEDPPAACTLPLVNDPALGCSTRQFAGSEPMIPFRGRPPDPRTDWPP
jgi:hypothetical protein